MLKLLPVTLLFLFTVRAEWLRFCAPVKISCLFGGVCGGFLLFTVAVFFRSRAQIILRGFSRLQKRTHL
jgi:Flp pilus assembly protein protease CpaA